MSPSRVANEVRGVLEHLQPRSAGISVVEDAIRDRDGWWHVPVKRKPDVVQTYDYYVLLAEAEQALEEAGFDVTLVPTGVDNVVN